MRKWVADAFQAAYPDQDIGSKQFVIERPRLAQHGDVSTNIALAFSSLIGDQPRTIAEKVREYLLETSPYVSEVSVAGPGFINFFLNNKWYGLVLTSILEQGQDYGRNSSGQDKKVQIEFVSANPVGPLHVGHGRWAVIGDALTNLLLWNGYQVDREFYINDHGAQVENFARSILYHMKVRSGKAMDFPDQGYRGGYIKDLADQFLKARAGLDPSEDADQLLEDIKTWGLDRMLSEIKATLQRAGVEFEHWASESSYYRDHKTDEVLSVLGELGFTYGSGGATWLRTSELGDEKDRVLVRANGVPTYFLGDIAYHRDKFLRGYDILINIWGADHHGYIPRVHAAMQALGFEKDRLEIIIGQLVNLFRAGEAVRMSKRTGDMVTFDELLDEVGKDAIRYLFSRTGPDTAIDFDIELAKKRSADNPVYYIQYAHARICSIILKAEEAGSGELKDIASADLSLLTTAREADLVKKLAEFEEVVQKAGDKRSPQMIPAYAEDLAGMFHSFYARDRVVSNDPSLTRARLALVASVKQVIANALEILGVEAPQSM